MIAFLERLFLLNSSLFFTFSFYSKLLTKVFLINSVFLWLMVNILKNKKKFYQYLIPNTPLNKNLLFFFIAAILSTVFSLNPYHSQKILFNRYLLYILITWLGYFIVQPKNNLNILIGAFILGGIIIGAGGMLDYLRIKPYRLFTSFGINIDFTFYLTMVIPLNFMILFFVKNKFLKVGSLIAFLLLLPCLFWNFSRASWVAIAISLLLISFLKNKRIAYIYLVILILLIAISLFFPNIKERIKTIPYPSKWSYRLPLYRSAICIFSDYPILGAGVGMYEKLLHTPKYELSKDYPPPREIHIHAHNTYLELAAEMGIIGFLAFLGIFMVFLIYVFKTIKAASGNKQAIILGLTGSVISGLILGLASTIITVGMKNSALFWFLFGMAIGLF